MIAGTIAIDNIIINGKKKNGLLGGSAPFASVAAHMFSKEVDVLSIVGSDFPETYWNRLCSHGVNLSEVTHHDGESFTWTGEYSANMNKRKTIYANDHIMTGWHVSVPEIFKHHPVIVAACMVPARQLELINGCSSPQLVLSDSMDKWISRQPELLDEVISKSHICTMNEDEAKLYAKSDSIIDAGEHLLAKGCLYAIIKQGEYGSILFGRNDNSRLDVFRCPAWPLKKLIDPTGAGDSFIGAIGGYLSNIPGYMPDFSQMKHAVVHATVIASFTCESSSAEALLSMSKEDFNKRLRQFTDMIYLD